METIVKAYLEFIQGAINNLEMESLNFHGEAFEEAQDTITSLKFHIVTSKNILKMVQNPI